MDDRNFEFDSLLSVSRDKAMKNREEARNYISIDLGNLARILSQYHPLELIKMAYWEERRVDRTTKDESIKEAARLMPVVLQSVVQSTLFKPHSYLRDVKKKDWTRVQSICQDIQRKLNRYIDFQMVAEYLDGRISRDNLERYNRQLHRQYFASVVREETLHMKTEFAVACMEGESTFFKERYGFGRHALGEEIEKIVRYSLNCIDDLRDSSSVHKTMMLLTMANLKSKSEYADKTDEELRLLALKQPELLAENKRLEGLRDDYDMFRPDFVSELPTSFYKELSAAPGTLDIEDYLFNNGVWPSAAFPFIDFGGLYFTFMGKSLLGLTQTILKTRFNLGQRLAVASESILASVLKPTDVDGVYSYEGEKVDVETLCPLGEVNAYRFPDLFQSRSERRKAEMIPHAMPGHIALILDPDGTKPLQKLGDGAFFVSLAYLLSIRNDRDARIAFYRTILPEAGIDKLDEKLDFEELEEDIIAPPAEVEEEDVVDDELALKDLDEDEVEEEEADDLVDDDDTVPEVSRYEVPLDEIRENERIYNENREVIEASFQKEKARDYEDRDLEDDYYQKIVPEDYSDEEEDEEEIAEHELDLSIVEEEEEEEAAEEASDVIEDEDAEEVEDPEQLDLLQEFDDEDLVDDTDEDEEFKDESPVLPVENVNEDSEIDEEEKLEYDEIPLDEEFSSPVEEDAAEPVVEEEIPAPAEPEIAEEKLEEEEITPEEEVAASVEEADEEPVFEEDIPASAEPGIEDENLEEETPVPSENDAVEPAAEESVVAEEQHETVAEEKEKEKYVPDPDIMRKLFGLDEYDEPAAVPENDGDDDDEETVSDFFNLDEDDERIPEEDVEDEGPTFVLDDPNFTPETPEVKEEAPVSDGKADEDAGFTLIDPDEETEEEADDKSTSILLGGSEIVDGDDAPDEETALEDEEEEEQAELPLFDEPKEESIQIPEMSDVVDLRDDDDKPAAEVADVEAEDSDEDLSGEGDALNGDIVLEYYDEEDKAEEEEKSAVEAEVVLSDEKEADARERVFTLSEEDVRESTASHTPVTAYLNPEETSEDAPAEEIQDETHTVDLGNPKFSETIRQIATLLSPDLGVFGSFIEKEDRPVLDYFNTVIKQCWERQCQDGKDKMFSIFEYDMSILLAKSKVYDALRENELMNNAGAVMYSKGKEEWNALILYVNKDYKVESVELRKITRDDFSPSNWKIVTVIGEELIARGQR